MDPVAVLSTLDGIALFAELTELGVSRRSLQRSLVDGTVRRLRPGTYALSDVDDVRVDAARVGAKLADATALNHLGLWTLEQRGDPTHLWVPPTARSLGLPARFVVHWDRPWSGDGRHVVSVLHALWQLGARCTEGELRNGPGERFLVAVESALNQQLIVVDDVDRLRIRLPRAAGRVLDRVLPSSQSGLESLTRWRLERRGIGCETQVPIPGVGIVDLLIGRTLLVELDGRATHSFESDRERDARAVAAGYVTLRFSYRQVMEQWASVEVAVLRAVELGLSELG